MKEKLAQLIRENNQKGWSPATSTNYSFKEDRNSKEIWISKSGIDKSTFSKEDFMLIDKEGVAIGEYEKMKPSAETLIHCAIYQLFPETTVILHAHSVFSVVLSSKANHSIYFSGYEIQKGFEGENTHLSELAIPVFENSQDMIAFSQLLVKENKKLQHHCFVMKKHGTYAWGKTLEAAKRHLETLEYLCECEYRTLALR